MERAYMNWSSGKDSALALYRAVQSGKYDVRALFTVVKKDGIKIAMHEIGIDLLREQANAIGIPLSVLEFDPAASAEEYQSAMRRQMETFQKDGVKIALFGDLYLEDLKKSREFQCGQTGMTAVFPLWGSYGKELLLDFVHSGFQSIVTCVNGSLLDESFLGRRIDESFIRDLPPGVDACGEKGEYHSFVYDGPLFQKPVGFEMVRKYCREYKKEDGSEGDKYWYLELQ